MYTATVTHRRWLCPVKFALEATVASELGVLCLSYVAIDTVEVAWSKVRECRGARPIEAVCNGDAIFP
jgi:hypothetical protein